MGQTKNKTDFLVAKNSFGFGLMEVLVSIGVLGILLAGSSKIFIIMMNSLAHVESKQELMELATFFKTTTFSSTSCENAIRGGGQTQQFSRDEASTPQVSQQPGMDFSFQLPSGQILSRGQTVGNFVVEDFFLQDALQVSSQGNGTTRYVVSALGVFDPTRKTLGPPIYIQPMGSFYIDVNSSNQIIGCSSDGTVGTGSNPGGGNGGSGSAGGGAGSCTDPTATHGTARQNLCSSGVHSRSICLSGTWVVVIPCPRDGE